MLGDLSQKKFPIPPVFNFSRIPNDEFACVIGLIGSQIPISNLLNNNFVDISDSLTNRKTGIQGYYDYFHHVIYLVKETGMKLELLEAQVKNPSKYLPNKEFKDFTDYFFVFNTCQAVIYFNNGLDLSPGFTQTLRILNEINSSAKSTITSTISRVISKSMNYKSFNSVPYFYVALSQKNSIISRQMIARPELLMTLEKSLSKKFLNHLRFSGLLTHNSTSNDLFQIQLDSFVHLKTIEIIESPFERFTEKLLSNISNSNFKIDAIPVNQGYSQFHEFITNVISNLNRNPHALKNIGLKSWFFICQAFSLIFTHSKDPLYIALRNKICFKREEGQKNIEKSCYLHHFKGIFKDLACFSAEIIESATLTAQGNFQDLDLLTETPLTLIFKLISSYNILLSLVRGPFISNGFLKVSNKMLKFINGEIRQCNHYSLNGNKCTYEYHKSTLTNLIQSYRQELEAIKIKSKSSKVTGFQFIEYIDSPGDIKGEFIINWLQDAVKLYEKYNEEKDPDEILDIPHVSNTSIVSSCSCGRVNLNRPDPFTEKSANHEFYTYAAIQCCSRLKNIVLAPNYLRSTRSGNCFPAPFSLDSVDNQNKTQLPIIPSKKEKSSKRSLSQSENSEDSDSAEYFSTLLKKPSRTSQDDDSIISSLKDIKISSDSEDHSENASETYATSESENESSKSRRNLKWNTTFHLGVPTLDHTFNQLPLFPAWSVYCLGVYSDYVHSKGVKQNNFLPKTNVLMPYNLSVHMNDGQKSSGSLIAFISFERECLKYGKRYFTTGTDETLGETLKLEEAKRRLKRLINNKISIFSPCQCSKNVEGDEHIAQIMRIFINLPNGPFKGKLKPRVRYENEEQKDIIFHLGPTLNYLFDNHNSLPDGSAKQEPGYVYLEAGKFWVMRLPYVYAVEDKMLPKEINKFHLLPDTISFEFFE